MSAPTREGTAADATNGGRSLRDELSALKIDRAARKPRAPAARPQPRNEGFPDYEPRPEPRVRPRRRGAGNLGLRLLSLLLWLIPLGLIGGGSYFAYLQYTKAQPKLVVKTQSVSAMTTGEAGRILSATGYIRSFQQAEIGSKTPGRIAHLFVKEGTKVEAGTPLAELEHADLDAQLASRRMMLARSESELNEAQVDLDFKQSKAQRAERLRAVNQMSIDEAEQAISAALVARHRVETLKAGIEYQKTQIAEIEVAIRDMTIFAPFRGTVLDKGAEVGETIMLGGLGAASGRGAVVTLADLEDLEVETDIQDEDLGKIKDPKLYPGEIQEAEIQVPAFPELRYRGVLDRVVPLGDRARGTVKVYVKIKNPDARLFPELKATVSFVRDGANVSTGVADTALYVPPSAVVEQDGSTHVWVVTSESTARKRPVQGQLEGSRYLVRDGLKANEKVIVSPDPKLTDGMLVSESS
jgi:RND family efflux transporter MFP subunit